MLKNEKSEIVRPCRKCGELYTFPVKSYSLDWKARIEPGVPRVFEPPLPIEWVCFECREEKTARLAGWVCKECGDPFQAADFLGPQEFCDGCGGDEELDLLKGFRGEISHLALLDKGDKEVDGDE